MGKAVDPADVTESGERCLRRLNELYQLHMPPGQLATAMGTAVEMHVSRALAYLVASSSVLDTAIGESMFEKLEKDMTQSWSNRAFWLKSGFGLTYGGVIETQEFDTLIQLRNSVVHGDGSLSHHQESDGTVKINKFRKDLKTFLDTELYGQLRFGSTAREKMITVARAFVLHFDTCLLEVHPSAQRF